MDWRLPVVQLATEVLHQKVLPWLGDTRVRVHEDNREAPDALVQHSLQGLP